MCVSKQEMKKKKQHFLNVPFDVCELYKDSHLNVFKGLIDEDGWALFYFRDQSRDFFFNVPTICYIGLDYVICALSMTSNNIAKRNASLLMAIFLCFYDIRYVKCVFISRFICSRYWILTTKSSKIGKVISLFSKSNLKHINIKIIGCRGRS